MTNIQQRILSLSKKNLSLAENEGGIIALVLGDVGITMDR
jgi:hypothetical protein